MRFWGRLLLVLGLVFAAQSLTAQSIIEQLITPGPLSNAHARFETKCESCHQSFSREAQNGKCLSCHRGITADVQGRQGFHGKSGARAQPCKVCHTEHKGRGFVLVRFNRAGFNHALTDYPLVGGHAKATCAGCHGNNTHYRGLSTTCSSCHAKKDPHFGRLGKNCAGCHTVNDWKRPLPFDHAKTGYALTGQHRTAGCLSCHAGQRWGGTPSTCISCHAKNDVHKGARGTSCNNCHTTAGWKGATFNHADTGFPLTGAHASATCAGCHGIGNAIRKPSRTCIGCHANDDVHKGRNGTNCASCHNSRDWKQNSFDHNSMTRFALTGAHKPLECAACHKQPAHIVHLPIACIGCHADDDPHKGKFGKDCASCHNVVSWKEKVAFDHALTRFPLVGKHAPLACTACHADKSYTAKGITCQSCHVDDHHAGTLGATPSCVQCHNSNDWKMWRFDHDASTDFILAGKHRGLICTACHVKGVEPSAAPTTCVACHRREDRHKGEFGEDCERCHVPTAWGEIKM
jgi:hypothetical protein